MEYMKFWPLLMVFGFPGMAFWLKEKVLKDYVSLKDLELIKKDQESLEQRLEDRIALEDKNRAEMWKHLNTLHQDLSEIKEMLGRIDERTSRPRNQRRR